MTSYTLTQFSTHNNSEQWATSTNANVKSFNMAQKISETLHVSYAKSGTLITSFDANDATYEMNVPFWART